MKPFWVGWARRKRTVQKWGGVEESLREVESMRAGWVWEERERLRMVVGLIKTLLYLFPPTTLKEKRK